MGDNGYRDMDKFSVLLIRVSRVRAPDGVPRHADTIVKNVFALQVNIAE